MKGRLSHFPTVFLATSGYAFLALTNIANHEPWADEAQAWLLARDSTLRELWVHLLHYEGTPGLWHTLLFGLTRLHLPYASLNYLAAGLGIVAAYLVFRFAPFPAAIRYPLPFTYFLAYQYAVVGRSYAVLPPILFGLAAIYRVRFTRPGLYALLLSALALCNVYAWVLAILITLFSFRHRAAVLVAIAAGAGVLTAWPPADVTFVRQMNYAPEHALLVLRRLLAEAFTGEWLSALVVVAATVPLLARGRMLIFFLLSAFGLSLVAAIIYGQVWHFGILFLAWVFSLWTAVLNGGMRGRMHWVAMSALGVVIAIHCFWLFQTTVREWKSNYSASEDVAEYLASERIAPAGVLAMGYACVAVQPYFPRNIFVNFEKAYWDWSSRNHMIADYERFAEKRPNWVLVGYKTDQENYLSNSQVRQAGYVRVRHFSGNLIWKGRAFEPESYDLYRRP